MKFQIALFALTIGCACGRYVGEADNKILKKCTEGLQEFADCVKYKAIKLLDNAIVNRKPIPLASFVYLTHEDDDSSTNGTGNQQQHRVDDEEREALASEDVDNKLNELLVKRVQRLVSTKNLQIKLIEPDMENSVEGKLAIVTPQGLYRVTGRKKKKDKGGMMMMMAGAGAMMMHAAMSKIAFIAGKALIVAKIALLISGLMLLKKMMSQEDSHESTQVIYKQAESGHGGGGGGGGGWHRSIDSPENVHAHQMAYGGQVHHEP